MVRIAIAALALASLPAASRMDDRALAQAAVSASNPIETLAVAKAMREWLWLYPRPRSSTSWAS